MSSPALSDPPRPQRGRRRRVRGLAETVLTVALAVAVALLVQAFVVKPYRIPTLSMFPTLVRGQRILVDRLSTHPGIGDVVVFHPPAGATRSLYAQCANPSQGPGDRQPCDRPTTSVSSQTYVKRVVGLPGDTLSIRHGHVYRNGHEETGAYVQPCPDTTFCTFRKPIVVPKGDYYMMGDNRNSSDDSRFWGPVPQSQIIGIAFMTYWPPDRIGTL